MNASLNKDVIYSKLWEEVAEPDNPFAARACFCSGYDVFGDVLRQATYLEYLYLLFRGERPAAHLLRSLEILAIAIANPGPRDLSVHAAMSASVCGSPAAAALMAALASGAGVSGGAREVFQAMQWWERCGCAVEAWQTAFTTPPSSSKMQVWPDAEHPPGFAPYGGQCAQPVLQTLEALSVNLGQGCAQWLADNRMRLEQLAGHPLAMPGVIAAALTDMGFTPTSGEMLTLLLRLPGAAAHALEQGENGFRRFPFFSIDITNDPGPVLQKRDAL